MELVRWKKYIVKNGKSYYLGLPQEWITSRDLDKDCEVDLILRADGSLLLEPFRVDKHD
jgi:hypothetical protein